MKRVVLPCILLSACIYRPSTIPIQYNQATTPSINGSDRLPICPERLLALRPHIEYLEDYIYDSGPAHASNEVRRVVAARIVSTYWAAAGAPIARYHPSLFMGLSTEFENTVLDSFYTLQPGLPESRIVVALALAIRDSSGGAGTFPEVEPTLREHGYRIPEPAEAPIAWPACDSYEMHRLKR